MLVHDETRRTAWKLAIVGSKVKFSRNIVALKVGIHGCPYNHLSEHYVKQQNDFSVASCGSSRISVLLRDWLILRFVSTILLMVVYSLLVFAFCSFGPLRIERSHYTMLQLHQNF